MSIHWGGRGAGHISRLSTATTGVPTLALDFLSGALDSRISFSRASPATVINASGAIETSPIDSPRFDFDPVTLARMGLLIEESRTNLLANSLISAVPLVTQNVTVTAVPHTLSFYGTGTVTLTGASAATVTGTGAYPNRRTITFTPIAGVLICTVVGVVQFAQLEIGAFATSFIPTAASPVTRSADVATMTGTNFSSWYNQSEGTFVCATTGGNPSTGQWAVSYDVFGPGNEIYVRQTSTTAVSSIINAGGSSSFTISSGAAYTSALAYKLNDCAFTVNGGAVSVTAATPPAAPTSLVLGALGNTFYLNKHIRRFAFYKTRLSNSTLQTLSQ